MSWFGFMDDSKAQQTEEQDEAARQATEADIRRLFLDAPGGGPQRDEALEKYDAELVERIRTELEDEGQLETAEDASNAEGDAFSMFFMGSVAAKLMGASSTGTRNRTMSASSTGSGSVRKRMSVAEEMKMEVDIRSYLMEHGEEETISSGKFDKEDIDKVLGKIEQEQELLAMAESERISSDRAPSGEEETGTISELNSEESGESTTTPKRGNVPELEASPSGQAVEVIQNFESLQSQDSALSNSQRGLSGSQRGLSSSQRGSNDNIDDAIVASRSLSSQEADPTAALVSGFSDESPLRSDSDDRIEHPAKITITQQGLSNSEDAAAAASASAVPESVSTSDDTPEPTQPPEIARTSTSELDGSSINLEPSPSLPHSTSLLVSSSEASSYPAEAPAATTTDSAYPSEAPGATTTDSADAEADASMPATPLISNVNLAAAASEEPSVEAKTTGLSSQPSFDEQAELAKQALDASVEQDQEALQSQIQSLESTVHALQQQLSQEQERQKPAAPSLEYAPTDELAVSMLGASNASKRSMVDEATGMTFETLFQEAQEEMKALRLQTLELVEDLEKTKVECQAALDEQERLQSSLETANDTIRFLKTEKDAMFQTMKETNDQLKASQEQTAVLQSKLDQTLQERDDAVEAKETLEATVRDADVITESLQEKLKQLEKDQPTLQQSSAKSRESAGTQDLNVSARGAQVDELEEELVEAKETISNLEHELEKSQHVNKKLEEGKAAWMAEREQMATRIDQSASQLVEEQEAWNKEREQMATRIDQCMDQLVDATEQVAQLKEEAATLKEGQERAMEASEKAERSRRASVTMVSSLNSTLAQKEADMDASRATIVDEKKALEDKIKEMEGTINQQKQQLQALNDQVDSLEVEKAQSFDQSNNTGTPGEEETSKVHNEQELKSAHDEVEELKKSVEILQSEKSKLVAELESVLSEKGQVTERGQLEVQGLKAEYEKALGDLKEKNNELEEIRRESKSLEKLNTKLLADLESADADNDSQLQQVHSALETLQAENARLSADLETVKSENAALSKVEPLAEEKETLISDLTTKLTVLESAHQALQQEKSKLDADMQQNDVELEALRSCQAELAGVKADYGKLLSDLKTKDGELHDVRRESQSLEKVNTKLLEDLESADAESNEQLQQMQVALETLQKENARLVQQLESIKSTKDRELQEGGKLLTDLQNKDNELQSLRTEADALEKMNTRLLNDLESADAEHGKVMEQMEGAVEALKTENTRLVAELEATTAQNTEREGEARKAQEELEKIQGENTKLQGDLGNLNADNEKLQGELGELRVANEEETKKVQASLEALQSDNERVLSVNDRLLKATESMDLDAKKSKQQLEALSAEKAELVAAVGAKTNENSLLKESVEALELSLKQSEATVASLKETMESLEKSSGASGEELKRLLSEKEELSSRALEQQALAEKNGREKVKVSDELTSAVMDKEALVEDVEILRRKLHEVNMTNETLESSLKETGMTVDKLRDTITMLETAGEDMLKAVEEEKQMLIEQLAETTRAKDALEKSLRENSATVESLRNTISMLETAGEDMLKAVEEEKQSLVEELELKAKDQVDAAKMEKKALESTTKILRKEMQESGMARGMAEANLRESQATIEKLRETIAMLESAGEDVLKAVGEEKDTLVGEVAALEASLNDSESALAATKEELALIVAEKTEMASELENTRSTLQDSCVSMEASRTTIQKLREMITALQSDPARDTRGIIEERKVATGDPESDSERDLHLTQKRSAELEATVQKLTLQLEQLSTKMKRVSEERTRVQAQLKDGKVLIHQAASQLTIANEKIASLSKQVGALKDEKNRLVSNLMKSTETYQATASEKEKLQEENKSLQASLMKSTEECQAAISAKATLEGALEQAKSELQILRDSIQDSDNQQANSVSRSLLVPNGDVDNAEDNNVDEADAASSSSNLQERIRGLEEERDELEAEVEELTEKMEELEVRAREGNKKNQRMLMESNNELVKKVSFLEAALQEGRRNLQAAEDRLNTMVSESYELEAQVETARYEKRTTVTKNEELEAKLAEAESAANALRGQIESFLAGKLPSNIDLDDSAKYDNDLDGLKEANVTLTTKLQEMEQALSVARKSALFAELGLEVAGRASKIGAPKVEEPQTVQSGVPDDAPVTADPTATVKSLREEKQALASKVGQLEDLLSEKDCKVSELEARLEEHLGRSADLKMRLAKKNAHVAELESEVAGQPANTGKDGNMEPLEPSAVSSDTPDIVESLKEEKQALTNKVGQLEDALSENSCKVAELEARVEEHLDRSAELKMRLARKTALVTELEAEVSSQSSNRGSHGNSEPLQPPVSSRDTPGESMNVESLKEEKQALTNKVGQLEDALSENGCKVAELEAKLEEHLGKSSDLKMRLARKTALVAELEAEVAAQSSGTGTEGNFEPLQSPGGNGSTDQNAALDALKEEKQALTAKVGQLEDALSENGCKVAELEAKMEEHLGKSSDLKMRLAKKTALVAELEAEVAAQSSSNGSAGKEELAPLQSIGDQSAVDALKEEQQSLSIKVILLEDALSENGCKIAELKGYADLKLRLATKTSLLADLEASITEQARSDAPPQGEDEAALQKQVSEPAKDVRGHSMVVVLKEERQSLATKVALLEDALSENGCNVTELDEYSDLNMRLAKMTALVAQLESKVATESPGNKQTKDKELNPVRLLPLFPIKRSLDQDGVHTEELPKAATAKNEDESIKAQPLFSIGKKTGHSAVDELKEEKQALMNKVGQLEDTLSENGCKVAELEARLEEQLNRSSDLKMRLARKTALVLELEAEVASQPANRGEKGDFEPAQPPHSADGNSDESPVVSTVNEEKRALSSKVGQLEDSLYERDCKVSELEARLEELLGKSADLKMRLARKTALVAELEPSAVSSDTPDIVKSLKEEKQALTNKVGQLEDALSENGCKVAELEARVEEHLGRSAELKMRLARKTALVTELEAEVSGHASNTGQHGNPEPLQPPGLSSDTTDQSKIMESLREEKQALANKVGQLEDALSENGCKVAELEARVEEHLGHSAELKMRLARKTALVAELEDEVATQSSNSASQPRELHNASNSNRSLMTPQAPTPDHGSDAVASLLQQQNRTLKARIAQQDDTIAEKDCKLSELEARLGEHIERSAELKMRLDSQTSRLSELEEELSEQLLATKNSARSAGGPVANASPDMEALTDKLAQAEAAIREKTRIVGDLEDTLLDKSAKIAELNVGLDEQLGKTADLKLRLARKNSFITDMQDHIAVASEKASAALQEKVKEFEVALRRSDEKLQESQEKLQAFIMAGGRNGGEGMMSENQQLLSKLLDAEAEAEDLREQVEDLIARSEELEGIADDEDALLREQVDTINAWNLALEASAERSIKELEEARAELEALKASTGTADQGPTQVALRSTQISNDATDSSWQNEKRALTAKVGQLDDTLAERECLVAELQARLEEYISKSADLKMRLARKTSLVSELEEELQEQQSSSHHNQPRATPNTPYEFDADSLQKEKQALVAKVGQLDDALAERNCLVSELEARLDEYVGKSADLKMRLARKAATITELEEELQEQSSGQSSKSKEPENTETKIKGFSSLEAPGPGSENPYHSPLVDGLQKEKRVLVARVGQLEDSLSEEGCKVAELQTRLEEYVEKSADLKMRLARKTALVLELQEELAVQASSDGLQQRELNNATTLTRNFEPSQTARSSYDQERVVESLKEENQALVAKLRHLEETFTESGIAATAAVGALKEEKEALSAKLGQMEESLSEKGVQVVELKDKLKDSLDKIAAMKMQLARNAALVTELEGELEEQAANRQSDATVASRDFQPPEGLVSGEETIRVVGRSASTFADAFASSTMGNNSSAFEELERENQILTVKIARTEGMLKKEKTNTQEQSSKINQLEDTIADKDVRIAELEVGLDEYVGISADLKMRLARRSATIVELQEELDGNSGREIGPDPWDAVSDSRALPAFEGASRSAPGEEEEHTQTVHCNRPQPQGGFPQSEESTRSAPADSTDRQMLIPLKDQSPSQQLQACVEDAKANEALFDQIASLVGFAEKKKKRLKMLNERLEDAMTKSRTITTTNSSVASAQAIELKSVPVQTSASTYPSGLAEEQAALQRTVQDLERQWSETRSQLANVHQMNARLEATLGQISRERESAVAARTVLESSLRAAQNEVRSLRVAVEAMEAERGAPTHPIAAIEQSQSDMELSEHPEMDPERTTVPTVGELLLREHDAEGDRVAGEAALERRARECREYLAQANDRLNQMEVAVGVERRDLEETIATCEGVLRVLSVERFREIRLLDIVMDKVLHLDMASIPVVPV